MTISEVISVGSSNQQQRAAVTPVKMSEKVGNLLVGWIRANGLKNLQSLAAANGTRE